MIDREVYEMVYPMIEHLQRSGRIAMPLCEEDGRISVLIMEPRSAYRSIPHYRFYELIRQKLFNLLRHLCHTQVVTVTLSTYVDP